MSVTVRQTLIGIGYTSQTDLVTPAVASNVRRISKLNAQLAGGDPVTENDAAEIGRGSEFASNQFTVYWNANGSLNKYLSSELAAWLFAFGLGNTVTTGSSAPYTHTSTPLDQTQSIALPSFTYIEQIKPGGSAVLDRAFVGCVLTDFKITVQSGPGRAASQFTANFVGTGKQVSPSAITLPSALSEHLLPSGSLGFTFNGVNYVTNHNIIETELDWNNNPRLDSGFYPGSGSQTTGDATTGQIRGRMEYGDRTFSARFVARYDTGSPELATLLAQSESAAVWTLSGGTGHSLSITIPRARLATATIGDKDGIVTVECQPDPVDPDRRHHAHHYRRDHQQRSGRRVIFHPHPHFLKERDHLNTTNPATDKKALFHSGAKITINLKRENKTVTVRFPEDEEWATRQAGIRTVIQRMGSGSTTRSEGVEKSDAALLNAIRIDGDADLDDAQASLIIERLSRADAEEAVPVANGYEIPLRIVGGMLTRHTMRIPSEMEIRKYRRGAFTFVDQRHGRQILKSNLSAIGAFYDTLNVQATGYSDHVPLMHKVAVITELTQTVDALDAEEDPENF